jgi:hypothetical protein
MRNGTKVATMLGAFGLISMLSACGGSAGASYQAPKQVSNRIVTGEYNQTANGVKGVVMSAVVTDGKITVNMLLDPGSEGDSKAEGTYWRGSFDTSNTSDWFTVTSDADLEMLNTSILGSQDDTKTFTYKNGDLSFPFEMVGIKTTVHLQKN